MTTSKRGKKDARVKGSNTLIVYIPRSLRRRKVKGPKFPKQLFDDWFGQFAEVHGKCSESPPQFFYA